MFDLIKFPGGGGFTPEVPALDAMFEACVGRLEDDLKEVRTSFKSIEGSLAEIKGRMAGIPTSLQLLTISITTWSVGAAIVFTFRRYGMK